MRKHRYLYLLVATFLTTVGFARSSVLDEEMQRGLESITHEEIRSMVYFLASDELEGRDTATLPNRIASQYIAHQFDLMGLEPCGDSKDYFQYFTLLRSELEGTNRFEFHRKNSPLQEVGVLQEDFCPTSLSASGKVTAPLAFAGFGITAPELGFDEYGDIDAEGRLILIFTGLPSQDSEETSFGSHLRTDFRSDLYKIKNAQEHGAVGAMLVHVGERQSFSRMARNIWPDGEDKGRFIAQFDVDQIRIPSVYCAENKIASLLQEEVDLEKLKREIEENGDPRSRQLEDFEATIETQVARSATRIRNVLACLPGSDPNLKDEVVIVSAHFDHVGKGPGKIFNGADDDASGTAGVIEVAEAFVEGSAKPKRSIVFALWNAEERGLFGSRYYTEHPPIPLGKTVALFQLDMIGRNQEVVDPDDRRFRGLEKQSAGENENTLHVVGASHSNDLRVLTESSNESIGLDLRFELDQHPLNIIRRSDHWPFLTSNVPALLLTTGFHPDYHTASDTADKVNYPKMEKIIRLAFLCAWSTANSESRPRFNEVGGGL